MNKKTIIPMLMLITTVVVLMSILTGCGKSNANQNDAHSDIDKKVDALLSKMSIEEKVGQMTQLTLDMICVGDVYNLVQPQRIDTAKLRKAIVDYKVGSILNCGNHALSREEWFEIISAIQKLAMSQPNAIPVLYGIDAIHGANYTTGATLFPQQIGQAATWNTEMVKQIASITAYETRASAIPWAFSPVLDMGRNPVWPRAWEGFGEDVHLTTQMGLAAIEGYQGNNPADTTKVAACLKHFYGYGQPLSGKDRTPAWIPERYMLEYHLPPFAAAIKAGALSLMINSGETNGIPTHVDYHILTEVLRNQLGFEGLAVTDWEDINYLVNRHRVAANKKEAVKMAVMAGIDMSMVPTDYDFTTLLLELVKEGQIPESRLDLSVRRILKVKYRLGLFERPVTDYRHYPDFASKASAQYSHQSAVESITLLKNDNKVLPIKKGSKILLTGPTANSMRCLNGGWSYTWQGENTDEYTKNENTVLEALQNKFTANNVQYVEGCSYDADINTQKAVAAAKSVDYVVLCLGELSYTEKPGDISDLYLPEAQSNLALALAATGKPVIVVLLEGRPRLISKFADKIPAIVDAYLPGNKGGDALADLLSGDANFSGKLPFTYPRYPNTLITYDHKYTEALDAVLGPSMGSAGFNPQFEFGHGLSYTTFTYTKLQLDKPSLISNGKITISVDVTNTGDREGKEIVQLYVSDLVASITPSVKRLRGFQKIALQAKETKTVTFTISPEDLAFVGIDNKWITEPGDFEVTIGNQKAKFAYAISQ